MRDQTKDEKSKEGEETKKGGKGCLLLDSPSLPVRLLSGLAVLLRPGYIDIIYTGMQCVRCLVCLPSAEANPDAFGSKCVGMITSRC